MATNTAAVVMIAIAGVVLVLTVASCCGCVTFGASPVASRIRRKRDEQREQKELHRRYAAEHQQQQHQVSTIPIPAITAANTNSSSPSGTASSQRALLSPPSSTSLNSTSSSSKSQAPSVFFSAKLRQQLASLGAAIPDSVDYSTDKIDIVIVPTVTASVFTK